MRTCQYQLKFNVRCLGCISDFFLCMSHTASITLDLYVEKEHFYIERYKHIINHLSFAISWYEVFMVYESQLLKSLWWKNDTLEMAAEAWAAIYCYYYFKIWQSFDSQIIHIALLLSYCINVAGKYEHEQIYTSAFLLNTFNAHFTCILNTDGLYKFYLNAFVLKWSDTVLSLLVDAEIQWRSQSLKNGQCSAVCLFEEGCLHLFQALCFTCKNCASLHSEHLNSVCRQNL